ncbi:MAG: radical SAM family heme chaperone HemW [Thermogemmatispora sp.]|uniref:radical SAM family heme chaperone HemW n=1 Tax=Thermogemmatispora sp. TaxID=1968838 RepID=UPI002621044B|nr:radical SAM family heme chaperone HemW [Thermogemmatispora sp.]MBX5456870.1 radical SAM family heme chaperone HemW [Thermogemmatispora sp.]
MSTTLSSAPCTVFFDEPLSALLESVSLYLHVPFCHTRCYYCDFNTYAGLLSLREPYVRALLTEIELAGEMARTAAGAPRRARTIYFGGGTPSLLSAEQIRRLLAGCRAAFAVDPEAEISLEANPGTLSSAHLQALRAAGVNRLSLGAQSFDPHLLKLLGRTHSPEEVAQAVRAARSAGFDSLNLDLMFGLPEQTMAQWRETLLRALELAPDHLSLYSLIVEEGTPFFTWVQEGRLVPADEDLCAEMYEYADALLQEAGYANYEISNWARPGHECRHNLTYWLNLPYLGLGAGAHSCFAGRRFSNVREPRQYVRLLASRQCPEAESETLSFEMQMAETAILALRTARGLHLPSFRERFGLDFWQFAGQRLQHVSEAGLLEYDGTWLRLSKRGRLLGNEVFLCLLPDED